MIRVRACIPEVGSYVDAHASFDPRDDSADVAVEVAAAVYAALEPHGAPRVFTARVAPQDGGGQP